MPSPNPQLQASIAQFASQPGVTPDHEAQLRATIGVDADLLKRLNQAAANHQLTGFALPAGGVGSNLVGTYDKTSGVVTLPLNAFQPTGTAASADLRATLRLQEMSVRFAHGTYTDASGAVQPVSQDMVSNLQFTINGAPSLAVEMKRAATTADPTDTHHRMLLENFAPLSGTVAGGTYNGDTKTMSLPPSVLARSPSTFQRVDSPDMTFVLGHETQHAFNHPDKVAAYRAFDTATRAIAADSNPINDYTAPVGQLISAGRDDEAKAQIAGWNALLSKKQQTLPNATLTDMMGINNRRLSDFIEPSPTNPQQARARSGLSFNPDATLSPTPSNIAAQAQNYFDKPPAGTPGLASHQTTGIGHHGDSDYRNYYGAGAVSRAIHFERNYAHAVHGIAPQMQLDLSQLKLREDLLERNGITLPPSNATTPQPYLNTGTNPPIAGLFQNTAASHQHISPIPPFPLESPPSPSPPIASPPRNPTDLDAHDRALLDKIRDSVRGIDQRIGKPWDEQSERISASLLTRAAQMKFSAHDDIRVTFNQATAGLAAGEVVHVHRVGHASPDQAAHHAHMTTADALSMPADERYRQVESIRQSQNAEAQRQQQELARGMNGPGQGAQKLAM
ncbi:MULTISPECIES: XVIPCD domain-containing protein [unclassified Lysobacter]|uniref:XVIPCD domain-containing protein n=1 Tax=unclassified Lysobacter TaxID=2635362 RepID=UPI001BEA0933|nr:MULTISPECIES: XVIPCD domain-containing protein [unclassified Lysobacter]MBT2745785.1 hypothetical protein [Lysobacter sp. ISL-42]MBT2749656.1 hypothetical protein [Lysobacter sp. ISL-50]MBT2777625.1 hypothetical protein [Lysobacter sp. ISL-54]MBT2782113.1 hypothetical protein [Lysobacter sp. ISL-52]